MLTFDLKNLHIVSYTHFILCVSNNKIDIISKKLKIR